MLGGAVWSKHVRNMQYCFFKKIEIRFYMDKSCFFPPKMLGIAQTYDVVEETFSKVKEYEQLFIGL